MKNAFSSQYPIPLSEVDVKLISPMMKFGDRALINRLNLEGQLLHMPVSIPSRVKFGSRLNVPENALAQVVPSIRYQEADAREAIRALMRTINVNYSISPSVKGIVNVYSRDITVRSAMEEIARQANFYCLYQDGLLYCDTFDKLIDGPIVRNAFGSIIPPLSFLDDTPEDIVKIGLSSVGISPKFTFTLSSKRHSIEFQGGTLGDFVNFAERYLGLKIILTGNNAVVKSTSVRKYLVKKY